MSYDERRREMEDHLDDFLDYIEKSGEYEVVEKIDHKEAIVEEAATKGFKFNIIVQER